MGLKPRILSVVILIFGVTLLFIVGIRQNSEKYADEHSIHEVKEQGVLAWCNAFSQKNFNTCDSMIDKANEALYSNRLISTMDNEEYYDMILSKLVDCISSIEVINVDGDDYSLEVTFKPYKIIDSLEVDDKCLEDAKEKVLRGSDVQFNAELSRVYLEIFENNCFNEDKETETRQQVLTLSEKEVNGVTCVSGTVSFVDNLLSDSNILENIKLYERDVKDEVNDIIKAY